MAIKIRNKIKTLVLSLVSLSFLASCAEDVNFSSRGPIPPLLTQLTLDQEDAQKKVDILFVIDNSSSMSTDLNKISSKFQDFISYISKSDYRIGFINTDVSSFWKTDTPGFYGKLKPVGENDEIYIDSTMSNQDELFMFAMKDQAGGSPIEKPLEAMLMAVEKRNTVNSDFFREGAQFISVIVCDEDESEGDSGVVNPQEVFDNLTQVFGETHVTSVVIGIDPADESCASEQEDEYSTILWSFAKVSNGMSVSICHPNMGEELRNVSSFVQSTLVYRDISLDPLPRADEEVSVKVTDITTGETLDLEWIIIDGHTLSFIGRPPLGSRIEVNYYINQE